VAEALLKIEGLTVRLPKGGDRAHAVEQVSFTVGRGEIVTVVGESGSGKSITAQAVMGLLPKTLTVTAGRIDFEGRDLLALSAAERRTLAGDRLAMVFQEPISALNPVFRIGRQIVEAIRLHRPMSEAAARAHVLHLLEEVRLPDPARLIDAYPHQLSGGQCQRAMIAMALALDPALLIADEPTTALDVTTQAQILKLILDLRARHGTGVVFITHDFGVVAEIADRVVVMRQGEVVEVGTAEEVLRRPRAGYTQALIRAVPTLSPRPARTIAPEPALTVSGVAKTYSRKTGWFARAVPVPALLPTSLTLHRGETVAVVGESGSGKSTLAQCVLRLVEPDTGAIALGGVAFRDLRGRALREQRRHIQIVFQDPATALDPRQSVGQAIAEGPIIHGLQPAAALARAAELLNLVGLDPSAVTRYPHQFSGGQRQRICIARALMMEPELLIADEAVSALDVSVQAQVLDLLEEIRRRLNLAMLFITHDLRVASQVCDSLVVMSQGRIVEAGPAHRVFGAPQHEYTRALFAAAPGRDFAFGAGAPAAGA
jgi:peptide/nickel transport system ATP-binding protein